jgi:Fibronectin type III domain
VTGNITMYDSAFNDQFPPDPQAVAGYTDGSVGDQPNAAWLAAQFPAAFLLTIALDPARDAEALDIEPGAAAPESAPGWYARQKARGIARPCLYASVSLMQSDVLPAITAAGIARESVRLWTAHYSGSAHICGPPPSCGQLTIPADGTQWTNTALGRALDQSLVLPDFFAPPPFPGDWVFGPVRNLTLLGAGPSSVKLSWHSPGTPMPLAVGSYQVTVRQAGRDVPSYPRSAPKGPNPEVWQGGSLAPGTGYTAMVRAVATDGGHQSPWTTVSFTTAA